MTITEAMIEAAVSSYFDAPDSRVKWGELTDLGRKHATEAFVFQLRHFLIAAEARGAILTVVPAGEEMPEWLSPGVDWPGWEAGFNACRAAVLAGRVVV